MTERCATQQFFFPMRGISVRRRRSLLPCWPFLLKRAPAHRFLLHGAGGVHLLRSMHPGALSLQLQWPAGFKKGASGAHALGLDRRRESLHGVASHDGHFGCKSSSVLVVLCFCAHDHAQREAVYGGERLNPISVRHPDC
jgi:hypothetical protein